MMESPNWAEVQQHLRPGEHADDRPNLIARAFRTKLKKLLEYVTEGVEGGPPPLGTPAAHTYVIEFQKRGLPHAHILVIMDKGSKPKSPSDIDKHVCAELPVGEDETEVRKSSRVAWYTGLAAT